MARFLVEVPHDESSTACARTVERFLRRSHFLTHADRGCKDGIHTAWIVVEVVGKAQP